MLNQIFTQTKIFKNILDSLPMGLLVTDQEGKAIFWNEALAKMTGLKEEEALGMDTADCATALYGNKRPLLIDFILKRMPEEYLQKYTRLQNDKDVITAEGFAPNLYEGSGAFLWGLAKALYDDEGNLIGALECLIDITDRKRLEDRLLYASSHDALTTLFNRAYFEETLSRLEKEGPYPISVIMADVDDLKVVNDSLGHAAGDEILKRTANILKKSFREDDCVARIGGDEFAVLLPKTDEAAAKEALERICYHLQQDNLNYEVSLNLSLGAATVDFGVSLTEALKMADKMMYADKFSKKRCFESNIESNIE